jgi:hypothetical protein
MTDPGRAGGLWLVLTVATRHALAVDGEAESAELALETIPEMLAAKPDSRAGARRIASADLLAPA